jgi:hypothetical protein
MFRHCQEICPTRYCRRSQPGCARGAGSDRARGFDGFDGTRRRLRERSVELLPDSLEQRRGRGHAARPAAEPPARARLPRWPRARRTLRERGCGEVCQMGYLPVCVRLPDPLHLCGAQMTLARSTSATATPICPGGAERRRVDETWARTAARCVAHLAPRARHPPSELHDARELRERGARCSTTRAERACRAAQRYPTVARAARQRICQLRPRPCLERRFGGTFCFATTARYRAAFCCSRRSRRVGGHPPSVALHALGAAAPECLSGESPATSRVAPQEQRTRRSSKCI